MLINNDIYDNFNLTDPTHQHLHTYILHTLISQVIIIIII